MNKLTSVLTNVDAPSAGFSEGQVRDDPGDGTGSGAIKAWLQDPVYAAYALIKKYIGAASDTLESETDSDVRDSIETMVGVKNPNTAEYDNTTAYVADDHVMYLGVQFVAMAATTGNNPFDSPALWLPCFNRDDAIVKWRNGKDIGGGMEALHNYRDAGYRQLFEWGKYNFGGDTGGSGRNFQATGVHLDGTQITGNATLEALFDVGGGDEYHLLDVIAPDVLAVRTLIDSRGRVGRIVDAIAGLTEDVGVVQEDAMQRITGNFSTGLATALNDSLLVNHDGTFSSSGSVVLNRPGTLVLSNAVANKTTFDNADSVSPNASKTNDDESIVKNYTTGVVSIMVMQEI